MRVQQKGGGAAGPYYACMHAWHAGMQGVAYRLAHPVSLAFGGSGIALGGHLHVEERVPGLD